MADQSQTSVHWLLQLDQTVLGRAPRQVFNSLNVAASSSRDGANIQLAGNPRMLIPTCSASRSSNARETETMG